MRVCLSAGWPPSDHLPASRTRSVPKPIRVGSWLLVAVLLGLGLRAYHYVRCPAVWHDEAALLLNVIHLPFGAVFGKLLHSEAAPPLFLAAEQVAVTLWGDGEHALRLPSFLAACGSVVVFAGLARRLLDPTAAIIAVGLFGVSDRLLWHSCEAKPYSVDVLVAVAAAWWFVRTDGWKLWRRCGPVAIAAPVAIWSSFPACFVAGGLLVGLFPAARAAGWRDRVAYLVSAGAVGASFLALALGPIAAQRCDSMDGCWTTLFPDWSRPWGVPAWVVIQTFEVARYCLIPFGQVFVLLAGIGAAGLWRRPGGRAVLSVLLLPIGLAVVAALLHQYPYGGSRVEVFAAPVLCLLGAEGVRRSVSAISGRSRVVAVGLTLALLVPPFAITAVRLVNPWNRAANDAATGYVLKHRLDGEPILVNSWEHEYYFRRLDGWRTWSGLFESADLGTTGRVWIVVTRFPTPHFCPFQPPDGWELADTRIYHGAGVFVLRRVPFTGGTIPLAPAAPTAHTP